MTTNLTPHLFWITSRAAGFAALVLASLAVALGLLMSTKLLKGRVLDLRTAHEILSLSAIGAVIVHAGALLGDKYLHPSLADITIPFVSSYKSAWTTLGIVSGWSLIVLGLSYYARRAIGEGTDAGQIWFLAMIAIVAIPAVALLATRLLGRGSAAAAKPRAKAP